MKHWSPVLPLEAQTVKVELTALIQKMNLMLTIWIKFNRDGISVPPLPTDIQYFTFSNFSSTYKNEWPAITCFVSSAHPPNMENPIKTTIFSWKILVVSKTLQLLIPQQRPSRVLIG